MNGNHRNQSRPANGEHAHPAAEELQAFLGRRLTPERLLQVGRHLETCPECVAALGRDPALRSARAAVERAVLGHDDRQAASARDVPAAFRRRRAATWTASAALAAAIAVIVFQLNRREASSPAAPLTSPPLTAPSGAAAVLEGDGAAAPGSTAPADFEALAPSLRTTLTAALRTGHLEKPAVLADLDAGPGTLLGSARDPAPFSPLAPVATVVETERPTFHWQPLAGAEGYEVHVYDADYHEMLASGVVASSSWTARASLPRGQVFSWAVTALKNGERTRAPQPPAPEARFRVLDRAGFAALREARPVVSSSPVSLGILFASLGLLDDAEAHLAKYLEANPPSPKVEELLKSIRGWRRER